MQFFNAYRYLSVEEYQRINIPLLMIESAEKSIRTGISSIHFKAALVTWVTDVSNGMWKGLIALFFGQLIVCLAMKD